MFSFSFLLLSKKVPGVLLSTAKVFQNKPLSIENKEPLQNFVESKLQWLSKNLKNLFSKKLTKNYFFVQSLSFFSCKLKKLKFKKVDFNNEYHNLW